MHIHTSSIIIIYLLRFRWASLQSFNSLQACTPLLTCYLRHRKRPWRCEPMMCGSTALVGVFEIAGYPRKWMFLYQNYPKLPSSAMKFGGTLLLEKPMRQVVPQSEQPFFQPELESKLNRFGMIHQTRTYGTAVSACDTWRDPMVLLTISGSHGWEASKDHGWQWRWALRLLLEGACASRIRCEVMTLNSAMSACARLGVWSMFSYVFLQFDNCCFYLGSRWT